MAFLLTFLVIFMISDIVVFCTHKKYSLPEEEKIMAFEAITMDRKLLAIGDRLLEKRMTLTSVINIYSLTKGLVAGETSNPYINEIKRRIFRHHNGRNISIVLHGYQCSPL